jgi:hypothetical protein
MTIDGADALVVTGLLVALAALAIMNILAAVAFAGAITAAAGLLLAVRKG